MNGFKKQLRKVQRFDVNAILFAVWKNPRVQNFIIELNTEGQTTSQLFEKGEDSQGVSLGDYSAFTTQIKIEKGQRIDHITLKDTGDFYETFVVIPFLRGFRIEADGDKGEGDNLFDDFGQDITGLSEENKIILICSNIVKEVFVMEATKRLSSIR